MSIVSDQDFGELHFDGVWKGICEMVFMGRRLEVELVVQTFDAAPISEVQRLAYREFNLNKGSISSLVEEAVFNYYLGRLEESRECLDVDEVDVKAPRVCAFDDMQGLISLKRIKVMSAFEAGVRQIGFIFDAVFDPPPAWYRGSGY
ncbi:DUF6985 domain-containing protein [Pseudomonas aeruginosa]|uniref:DUF6985 domain-containing protein n=1 Tax=Pseudomonas aeruginosa TaxID=287 RepID=UPI00119DE78F|nr:hypothetical protein [Pseudomonas aeruginosa]MEC6385135.1 hypothetical protein [Pseudomonas aeruginosa]MWW52838.1 hypothetical protein [Pseudomonas aeruginosa]